MELQVELEFHNLSSSQSPSPTRSQPHKTRPGHGCVAADAPWHAQSPRVSSVPPAAWHWHAGGAPFRIQVVYSRPCNEIHFLSQASSSESPRAGGRLVFRSSSPTAQPPSLRLSPQWLRLRHGGSARVTPGLSSQSWFTRVIWAGLETRHSIRGCTIPQGGTH
jgi:hypothetical protein